MDVKIKNNRFVLRGNEVEFRETLQLFMSEDDAEKFAYKGTMYREKLNDDECFTVDIEYNFGNSNNSNMPGLLVEKSRTYNINLTALTIIAIATALDVSLKLGFIGSVLTIIGFKGQAIAVVDVNEGEKCLIREAMLSDRKMIDENVYANNHSECVNNDLPCRYREDSMCIIGREKIRENFISLCEKNIFREVGSSYKYNF